MRVVTEETWSPEKLLLDLIRFGCRTHADNYRLPAKIILSRIDHIFATQGPNFFGMGKVMKGPKAEKSIQSAHLSHGVVTLVLEGISCEDDGQIGRASCRERV